MDIAIVYDEYIVSATNIPAEAPVEEPIPEPVPDFADEADERTDSDG